MKGFIEITKKEERISIAISNIAAVSEKEAGCIISLNSPFLKFLFLVAMLAHQLS
jgi:hypothetical protein